MALGLVEEQDVGATHEASSQHRELALSPAQLVHGPVEVVPVEAELRQAPARLAVEAVAAELGEAFDQARVAFEDPLHPAQVARDLGLPEALLAGLELPPYPC